MHTTKASTDDTVAELITTTATDKNMNNFYNYSNANSERNKNKNRLFVRWACWLQCSLKDIALNNRNYFLLITNSSKIVATSKNVIIEKIKHLHRKAKQQTEYTFEWCRRLLHSPFAKPLLLRHRCGSCGLGGRRVWFGFNSGYPLEVRSVRSPSFKPILLFVEIKLINCEYKCVNATCNGRRFYHICDKTHKTIISNVTLRLYNGKLQFK